MLARQARRAILPNRQSRPWGELSPETLSMNDVWKVLKVSDDVENFPSKRRSPVRKLTLLGEL